MKPIVIFKLSSRSYWAAWHPTRRCRVIVNQGSPWGKAEFAYLDDERSRPRRDALFAVDISMSQAGVLADGKPEPQQNRSTSMIVPNFPELTSGAFRIVQALFGRYRERRWH
jgi:hypothetical protein